MRLLLFLSALLAALSGATASARAIVGVERSASAATPARQVVAPVRVARVAAPPPPGPAAAPTATLPHWAIAPATPRWVDRLRI